MLFGPRSEPTSSPASDSGGHDSAHSAASAPPQVLRGDEVMANLARLRQGAAQAVRNPWNVDHVDVNVPIDPAPEPERDREAEREELRQRQRRYFDAYTMPPTVSFSDTSGWVPPWSWQHGEAMHTPSFFAHPR